LTGSIRKRGKGFVAVIDLPRGDDGKRRQKLKRFRTRKEAEEWMATMLAAIHGGAVADPGRLTVGGYLDRWLAAVGPALKPNTRRNYTMACVRWKARIGQVPLAKLTPLQVQLAVNDMADTLAVGTVRRSLATLRTALAQGKLWGIVPRNAADGVKAPAGEREMRCLDERQTAAFLAATRGWTRYDALFRLALATGMRLGELLGLRWEDVDWETGTIHVRRSLSWPRYGNPELLPPKSAASRRAITVDATTLAILREHRERQEREREAAGVAWQNLNLVFCTRDGGFVMERRIQRLMPRAAERAGVPRIRFHDLRHTHATLLLRQGRNVKEVSERLGHANVGITLRTYAHVLPDQRAEAARVIGSILDGADAVINCDQAGGRRAARASEKRVIIGNSGRRR
jgi:integrase